MNIVKAIKKYFNNTVTKPSVSSIKTTTSVRSYYNQTPPRTGERKQRLIISEFKDHELNIIKHWFLEMEKNNPELITNSEYRLAGKVFKQLNLEIPDSIVRGYKNEK